jgi:hypothetical protein
MTVSGDEPVDAVRGLPYAWSQHESTDQAGRPAFVDQEFVEAACPAVMRADAFTNWTAAAAGSAVRPGWSGSVREAITRTPGTWRRTSRLHRRQNAQSPS